MINKDWPLEKGTGGCQEEKGNLLFHCIFSFFFVFILFFFTMSMYYLVKKINPKLKTKQETKELVEALETVLPIEWMHVTLTS